MPKDSPARIGGLDGLRAISILLVFCAHATGTIPGFPQTRVPGVCGDLGVRTFFVISGFLITTLLVRERAKTGAISLRGFYVRRIYRIFPAFYTYLAAVALFATLGWFVVTRDDYIFAVAYSMNYHHADARAWQVGHLWSLAVEEQFYLLWPAVMLLGDRGALRVAIAAIVLAPILRVVGWYALPGLRDLSDSAFPYVADALASGCVLALARERLEASPAYRTLLDGPWFWLVPLVGVGALSITRASFNLPVGITVANLALALTIHRCVRHAEGPVRRLLESAPLVWIGTLSYSLYLWQQLFLNRHSDAWPNQFPVNVIGAVLAGCCSYYLVERPILRWYGRISGRRPVQPKRPVM